MPSARRPALIGAALLGLLAAGPARAQDADDARVEELLELVARRPSGMDRDAWRQERREAARALGRSGDPRAVPVLIEIVETERFDVVSEIAIEALGELGDDRAIEPLRTVIADRSRDRYVREKARAALARLGVSAGEPAASPGPAPTEELGAGPPRATAPASSMAGRGPVAEAPPFADDLLAASDRLTFALGGVRLQLDTARDTPSLDGDVAARFERVRERERLGTRITADASAVAGLIDFEGDDSSSRLLALSAAGSGEARFYAASRPIFALARGDLGATFDALKVDRPGADDDSENLAAGLDVGVALGAGYGRVLDVGAALRVRRIETVLRQAGTLARPIPPDLRERIHRAWWALRGEIGYHERLVATIALLREAGVVLAEPDASTSYQLLQVLADGALERRPSGWQAYGAIGERLTLRDDDLGLPEGRAETLLAAARYGRQSADGTQELLGEAGLRYQVLTDDGDPAPWRLGGAAVWRRYRYGERWDLLGALDLRATAGLSSDGGDDSEVALGLGAEIGWLWIPNRASRYRLAASGRYESGELFLGAVLELAHGLLDASYVGRGAPLP